MLPLCSDPVPDSLGPKTGSVWEIARILYVRTYLVVLYVQTVQYQYLWNGPEWSDRGHAGRASMKTNNSPIFSNHHQLNVRLTA